MMMKQDMRILNDRWKFIMKVYYETIRYMNLCQLQIDILIESKINFIQPNKSSFTFANWFESGFYSHLNSEYKFILN